MAPIAQYLMTESAEVALARSAAPASISGNATIAVLKPHGYETAVKGQNGFVCIVERSWMSPFDWPEFWNPKMLGPIFSIRPRFGRCRLPTKGPKWSCPGLSKPQMIDRLKQVIARREIPSAWNPGQCVT